MSDLHGCYYKYIKMIEKINFSNNYALYILGDIVDRGPDGIEPLKIYKKAECKRVTDLDVD
ncbi:MAG: metallophosphoesterase [Clostridia bacterium]|nr:metallophosphoesterase [Clostridia bacterium]